MADYLLAILDGFIGYFEIVGAISFLSLVVLRQVEIPLVGRAVEELLFKLIDFDAFFTLPFDGHVLHLKLSQRFIGLILRLRLGSTLSLPLNGRARTDLVIILQFERTGA